MDYSA